MISSPPPHPEADKETGPRAFGKRLEKALEDVLFASRWLLAPFYFALVIALAVLLVKLIQTTFEFALHAVSLSETGVILEALSLIDLTLTGSLIVIVIFSGYENFVSRINAQDHKDWPEWMGTIDFTGLKLKLMSSIVAISGIHLLKAFMNIKNYEQSELMWLVIIHMAFVISGLLMAWSDRIAAHGPSGKG